MAAAETAKVVKFVGRTTYQQGKTLWEIVSHLKNFGVGRIITRTTFERYPEPTFMKIVKVESVPDEGKIEENRKVRVWVKKTFRGKESKGLVEIFSVSYKPDYKLIPKDIEDEYCKLDKVHDMPDRILPKCIEMPPLMKEFVLADCTRRKVQPPQELVVPVSYNRSPNRVTRIENETQKATVKLTMGLGTPISPSLYKGINL